MALGKAAGQGDGGWSARVQDVGGRGGHTGEDLGGLLGGFSLGVDETRVDRWRRVRGGRCGLAMSRGQFLRALVCGVDLGKGVRFGLREEFRSILVIHCLFWVSGWVGRTKKKTVASPANAPTSQIRDMGTRCSRMKEQGAKKCHTGISHCA